MYTFTTKERIQRLIEKKPVDRIPIVDSPWHSTWLNWIKQGLNPNLDWHDYFGVDKIEQFNIDISPRYPEKVVEETADYIITTSNWGATLKNFKFHGSVPEFLDFKINSAEKWYHDAKPRMQFDPTRVNLAYLEQNYNKWRSDGRFIMGGFWFGFDVTHSWFVGTETLLIALLEDPDWVFDMFNHFLDMCILHHEYVLSKGYTYDAIQWPDDMGFKNGQFFSHKVYRDLLKPVQKRAVDWAKSKGMSVYLHSCGNILPFVPDLIELGVDILNPLEVKAGMDPYIMKKNYGKDLVLHGGLNAILFNDMDKMEEEMKVLIPILKQGGGYICGSDHSIPDTVSCNDFKRFVKIAKQLGQYD